jgi:serine/threonine protein kinase
MGNSIYCASCGTRNRATAKFCIQCGAQTEPLVPGTSYTPLAQQNQTQRIGTVLQGQYAILRLLGSGGMGQVYLAQDLRLGNRLVALKAVNQQGLTPQERQEATRAFTQEALLLAGLVHPNLPRVYAYFTEEECSYLVMDYIQGETLEEYLAKMGTLSFEELLPLAVQLCDVLDYLHNQQPPIIFRDLKPANIMLVGTHLYLIDFGIARHFKANKSKDTVAMGSQGYAAPEQYGKAQTSARADTYALGAVMHQMLTGDDPSEQPFFFKPVTHPHVQALLEQMLVPDPGLRLASAQEVKERLLAIPPRSRPRKKATSSSTTALVRTTPPGLGHQQPYFTLPYSHQQNAATIEILELLSPEDSTVIERGEKLLKALGRAAGREIQPHRGIADLSSGTIEVLWQRRIQQADLVLIFVSADLLADDELMSRVEQVIRACRGKKPMIPVWLRPCLLYWESKRATIEALYNSRSPLAGLAQVPERKPITAFKDRNTGWLEVIEAVRQQLKIEEETR